MILGQMLKLFFVNIKLNLNNLKGQFDAIILAVAHNEFKNINIRSLLNKETGVIYDVKGILPKEMIDARL